MPQYYIPVGEVVKLEPKSEGIDTPRKKRPKELAVITECCTGCAGSPACVPYCLVAEPLIATGFHANFYSAAL